MTDYTRIPAELRAEIAKTLNLMIGLVEGFLPVRSHEGACGPESGCDVNCMDLAAIGSILSKAETLCASLTPQEPAQEPTDTEMLDWLNRNIWPNTLTWTADKFRDYDDLREALKAAMQAGREK